MQENRLFDVKGTGASDAAIPLRAGPLEMVFEPGTAFLRSIRLGPREVLRGIYAAVRDADWGTVPPRLSDLRVDSRADSFSLSFSALCRRPPVDFVWTGRIDGAKDGSIRYRFDGRALSSFQRNRIGFCVLHPAGDLAGRPCQIETVSGETVNGRFPDRISPHQPFLGLRAITHHVQAGISAEVRMLGEIFEMEDQRNWTDASYKTYCTPLSEPFPVRIGQGHLVQQEIRLRLIGEAPAVRGSNRTESAIEVTLKGDGEGRPMPRLGLGAAGDEGPLRPGEVEQLGGLRLDHLRVDLRVSRPDRTARLKAVAEEASRIGWGLELAILADDDDLRLLETLAGELGSLAARIDRVALLRAGAPYSPLSGESVDRFREALVQTGIESPVGGGTNAFFTELNRFRPDPALLDFLCYSINPQVHAFDDLSIAETLEAQPMTVRSALHFSGGKPVVVSPVTLKPRFNPNASGTEKPTPPGELPVSADPRQPSGFCAAWALGSVAALAGGGAASVTLFETVGCRGVMERESGSPFRDQFPSSPGQPFPVYALLAAVSDFREGRLLPLHVSEPLSVAGLYLKKGDRSRILLGNLTGRTQRVRVAGLPSPGRVESSPLWEGREDISKSDCGMTNGGSSLPAEASLLLPGHAGIRLDL